jgi:hypothetical protein
MMEKMVEAGVESRRIGMLSKRIEKVAYSEKNVPSYLVGVCFVIEVQLISFKLGFPIHLIYLNW